MDAYGTLGLETPTVQMNPTCRPFLRGWAELQRGLAIDLDIEALLADPLKEAWDLYEYWCWFELCNVVEQVVGRKGRTAAVKTEPGDVFVGEENLQHGLMHNVIGREFNARLHYNRTAPATPRAPYWSYSRRFRPDIALEVQYAADRPTELFLFDAKYRVDVFDGCSTDDIEEKRAERRGYAKTDDLKVMHGYRDAVRTADGVPARWVLSLFPGTEPVVFAQGAGRRQEWVTALSDRELGGVGAVPCRPGSAGGTGHLELAVRALLS